MLSLSLQLIDNFLELLLDEEESLGCHDFFVKVLVEKREDKETDWAFCHAVKVCHIEKCLDKAMGKGHVAQTHVDELKGQLLICHPS